MNKTIFPYDEALKASLEYFDGDELAATTFLNKYALKDDKDNLLEKTPTDMHRRMAREFARIEAKKFKKPMTEDEIFGWFDRFEKIIPQGSPMAGIGNPYQTVSLSNCFVAESPEDSYGSIFRTDQQLAQICKRRGGVGVCLDNLRPAGSPTSNAAKTSTGTPSFAERFSNTIREVGQNNRRGALMEMLSVTHPDIEAWANMKRDRTKVTGANVSIKLTDKFMDAVTKNGMFTLQWPIDSETPTYKKEVEAKKLWDNFIDNAWENAEPGLVFWDKVLRESLGACYEKQGFKEVAENPCVVGNTKVATADGRNSVPILTLANEDKDVPVYSTDPVTGQVQIKMASHFRKTGDKKEVWKLILDDDSCLIATPDHQILKKDGTYSELKDLKPGESLSPFNSFNSNRYRQICNVGAKMRGSGERRRSVLHRNRRQYRIIHEFYFKERVDPKIYAIHHKNNNPIDDRYNNLAIITHEVHRELHNIRGERNPLQILKRKGLFEAFKSRSMFYNNKGENNSRYIPVTNDELLEHGRNVYKTNGVFTEPLWIKYALENKLPRFLSNKFRFGSFKKFQSKVIANHKVKSVEFCGHEDVYDCYVEDNHNFCVITSQEDEKAICSSGICVHNCGEIPLPAFDACRLLLLNLWGFIRQPFTENAKFDYTAFAEAVKVAQRLMDNLVDLEIECVDKVIKKIKSKTDEEEISAEELRAWSQIKKKGTQGRRTGTGITALGDVIAGLGLKYGSDESIKVVDKIYKALKLNAYRSSVEMAKELGAFPIWDQELEKNNPFLLRIKDEDEELWNDMKKHGRRNIALLTTAPAGTVSIESQTTSGIEPLFKMEYTRKRKVTDGTKSKVDSKDAKGDQWEHFTIYHPKLKVWMKVTGLNDIRRSPYNHSCANDIDWQARVKLQAAAQKHVDHAISSTVNLPESISKEEVSKIYMAAWSAGCKGITVYREGSRDGVLVDTAKLKGDNYEKRPETLPCEVNHCKVKGQEYFVVVGINGGGLPYEVFAGKNGFIPKEVKTGTITKLARGAYQLKDSEGKVVAESLTKHCEADEEGLTRLVSVSLRHKVPLQYVVHQLEKTKGEMFILSKAIARCLKKMVKDGCRVTGETCPTCGNNELIRQSGCVSCSCGWTKCM